MDNTKGIGVLPAHPSVKSGKNYFLGIGINDYTSGLSALNNAVRDVERVGQILQAKYDFNILTILTNAQATRSEILKQLRALQNLSKDDSLLIYYSGHGHLAPEDGYWIPVNADVHDIHDYIPNAQLRGLIRAIPTRHTLLIADSCYSGSFFPESETKNMRGAADELEKYRSRWAFCSGRHDQKVSDGTAGTHSPFAEALITELERNNRPKMYIQELAIPVINRTAGKYRQTPKANLIFDCGDDGGQFVFALKDNEEDDWLNVNPNSVSALEAFKKKHPFSKFGVEADKIIAQLKKEKLIREHTAVWERTKRINTSDAYLDFWEKYKESPYRSEARQRLADAEDHEEWKRASHTRAGILDYLDKFPKGLHAADAQAALDAFRNQQVEKLRLETEKEDKEKREKAKAETDRLEKEQKAKEEAQRKKLAQDRVESESLAQQKQANEKIERERLEHAETERKKQAEAERLRQEHLVKEMADKKANEKPTEPQQPSAKEEPSFFQRFKMPLMGGALFIAFFIWLISNKNYLYFDQREPQKVTVPFSEPKMVQVQGGTFKMGSNENDDEKPVHSVTVSSFSMGIYEVTLAQFKSFVEDTGYKTDAETNNSSYAWDGKALVEKKGVNWRHDEEGIVRADLNYPVIHVSWNDATAYSKWLSQKTGKNYRLPTEAEWEYAAGNGVKHTKFSWGNNNPSGKVGGNVADETAKKKFSDWSIFEGYSDGYIFSAPVGSFNANELGLYDMTGNVWEWCSDWYDGNYYKNSPAQNPQGPSTGSIRVLRGGSWNDYGRDCRSSLRGNITPVFRYNSGGFRLVSVP